MNNRSRKVYSAISLLLLFFALLGVSTTEVGNAAPPAPVVFSKQILPLLRKECWSCHSGNNAASGYSLENRVALLKGGRHGVAVVVGKGVQSSLVKYLTGENKPQMPPNGAIDKETIALLRRWIDEGAKTDSFSYKEVSTPNLSGVKAHQRRETPAPVTALAFSPDGTRLAVAGYQTVRLLETKTGKLLLALKGMADQVQALAWSGDGKRIACAGGSPGVAGEVAIVEAETGKTLQKLSGHTEVVVAVAWRPNSEEIATGSLDKTVRFWNAMTGSLIKTVKDHADAISSVAYSDDGKRFASGSTDRSVKVYSAEDGKRLAVLNAHQEGITRIAFRPQTKQIVTVGADKTARVWSLEKMPVENPDRVQHEDSVINACAFSPDGNLFVWGAVSDRVRLFNGDASQQKQEFKEPEDWVYAVAIASDNDTLAAGTQDGKIYFWSAKANRRLRTVMLSPKGITIEEAKP